LQAALRSSIATYIRIGKKGEPVLHVGNPNFEIGKVITVRPGEKVALLAHGTILSMALDIAERVRSNVGIQPEVVSFHSVKPLDHDYLQRVFAEFSAVVTIEEHSRLGGFGSAIAEWVIDNLPNQAFKLKRFGLNDEFLHEAAETDHARMVLGLSADEIYSYVVNL
jgi:transketolase